MIVFGLNIVVLLLAVIQKWLNRDAEPRGGKSNKPYRYFKLFLLIAPAIAAIVFAILFSTILTGRFNERCSHALLVLMLWLFATSFYMDIVFFWKNKRNRIICIVGLVGAVGAAVLLTPLDNYITLMGNLIPVGTYILGFCMLVVHYAGLLLPHQK